MLLLGLFGGLGLLISAVGVHGVMGLAVSQRTREIGVRLALGARPAQVAGLVLRHAAVLVASGLLIGGVAAWNLSAAAEGFLFEMQPTDAGAFTAALVVLAAAALLAAAAPARRAVTVDPVTTLRAE